MFTSLLLWSILNPSFFSNLIFSDLKLTALALIKSWYVNIIFFLNLSSSKLGSGLGCGSGLGFGVGSGAGFGVGVGSGWGLGFGSVFVLLHAAATSGKVMTLAIDPGVCKILVF
ncbi:hypothetical protein DA803_01660 [[Mycoplasma] phocae]|uniref:Uncharacterized protein n=1 Tax=[Mycoplasma] phocae TaxID=142651 RepID=A0A2Z5IQ70_9BACT|nr:hypothetical protein DA803_01660 [[Mycoplasma] phocae]